MSETDVELSSLEALDWEIPCERKRRWTKPGAEPRNPCNGEGLAEWVMHRSCGCNPAVVLYCTACKDSVLVAPVLWCRTCDQHFRPAPTAYALIEPLRRTSAT